MCELNFIYHAANEKEDAISPEQHQRLKEISFVWADKPN